MAYQHSEKLAKVQELLARTIDRVSSSPERRSEILQIQLRRPGAYIRPEAGCYGVCLVFAVEQAGTLRKARKYRHSLA